MILLTIGPTHTLDQNVVYAMPARAVSVFSNNPLEYSNDSSTGFTTTGATVIAAAFVRVVSTTAPALVTLKA